MLGCNRHAYSFCVGCPDCGRDDDDALPVDAQGLGAATRDEHCAGSDDRAQQHQPPSRQAEARGSDVGGGGERSAADASLLLPIALDAFTRACRDFGTAYVTGSTMRVRWLFAAAGLGLAAVGEIELREWASRLHGAWNLYTDSSAEQ